MTDDELDQQWKNHFYFGEPEPIFVDCDTYKVLEILYMEKEDDYLEGEYYAKI